ncbi:MAG: hypothetical protein V1663_03460 [archaeon]
MYKILDVVFTLPYEESCCYWTSFMINYYNWQNIIIYSSSGGGGWSQGNNQ